MSELVPIRKSHTHSEQTEQQAQSSSHDSHPRVGLAYRHIRLEGLDPIALREHRGIPGANHAMLPKVDAHLVRRAR